MFASTSYPMTQTPNYYWHSLRKTLPSSSRWPLSSENHGIPLFIFCFPLWASQTSTIRSIVSVKIILMSYHKRECGNHPLTVDSCTTSTLNVASPSLNVDWPCVTNRMGRRGRCVNFEARSWEASKHTVRMLPEGKPVTMKEVCLLRDCHAVRSPS